MFLSWKTKVFLLAVLKMNCTLQYKCETLIFPDLQNKSPANPGLPSLNSMDEEQALRDLAERMGQLHVQETNKEVRRKEEKKRGENTYKERRKNEREASKEGEAEEQNLRKPVMETAGPALSHAASRCTRSSQSDPTEMKEQKQPSMCHPSPLSVSNAACQNCKGGSTGQQEGEDNEGADTGRGEEEQLAQSYVIVEHHKK